MSIPTLDREAVRELDRRAIEEFGIPGVVLMENAGRGCADALCRLGVGGPVAICCGAGNNAGDGLVLARHLDLRGVTAQLIFWSDPAQLSGDAGINYAIAEKARLPIHRCSGPDVLGQLERQLEGVAWIVDALLGTGARGAPRAPLDRVIERLNAHAARKLSIDIPSGLDCQSGLPAAHTFRADHTCTFVAAKPGLLAPEAKPWVGQLHVLDIGVPRALLREFGVDASWDL
ncbi:MAG: NAD(P)H-hydrate epimerase [Pirellulaceae bacterium]